MEEKDREEKINIVKKCVMEDIKYYDEDLILKNLDVFGDYSLYVIDLLHKYEDDLNKVGYSEKLRVYSIEERLNFVKEFYKNTNINLDIDSLVKNGTIDFVGDNYLDEDGKTKTHEPDIYGYNLYDYDSKFTTVDVQNTGYFFDSIVLSHELSHYREKNDMANRTPMGNLLTEALADTEQFMFCDYYKDSHKREVDSYIANRLLYYCNIAKSLSYIIIPYYLYYNCGDISEKAYIDRFGEEYKNDFYLAIDYFDKIDKKIEYLVASFLSPYLFKRYKEDKNFLKVLNELHENPENYKDIKDILELLDLPSDSRELKNVLLSSLEEMATELVDSKKLSR